jgi:hypothetical protein
MEDLLVGVVCRPVFHYAAGQVFETLMRHVLAAVAIPLGAGRVSESAGAAPLVLLPGLALFAAPLRRRAVACAILVAAIAATTDEEDLAAFETATHGEAQRLHGSGRDRQELDVGREPCDEGSRRARLWAYDLKARG